MKTLLKILVLFLIVLTGNAFAQCGEFEKLNFRPIPDSVLELPLLGIKTKEMQDIVDKALVLKSHFDFSKDSIWVFFQIDFLQSRDSVPVTVKLLQKNGTFGGWNICNEFWGYNYYGAFCYQGYTFFIFYHQQQKQLCEQLFSIIQQKHKFETFSIKYRFTESARKGYTLNTTSYFQSYHYFNNAFFLRGTSSME